MNIVSAVANLQKELDYYRDVAKEYAAIVRQLTEGVKPGEVEYIHPFDVAEMLDAPDAIHMIDVWKKTDRTLGEIIEIGNPKKKYKQSALIPAKSKRFK
jgi:hypothetical protein